MNIVSKARVSPKPSRVRTEASLSWLPPLLVVGVLAFGLATHSVFPHAAGDPRPHSGGNPSVFADEGCQEIVDHGGFVVPTSADQRRRFGSLYAMEIRLTYRAALANRVRRRTVGPAQRPALDYAYMANVRSYNALATIYPEMVGGKTSFPHHLTPLAGCGDNSEVDL